MPAGFYTRPSLEERLSSRIRLSGDCWIYSMKLDCDGYGKIKVGKKTLRVHRVALMVFIGEDINTDLVTDHLCKNRACINPFHLELVTSAENVLRGDGPCAINKRKTHCKRGHEFTDENIYKYRGMRHCRICRRINDSNK